MKNYVNQYDLPLPITKEYEPYYLPKNGRLLVFGDVHIPYHNINGLNIMIGYALKENITSILINGDFFDHYTLSPFMKDPDKKDYKKEIESGRELLQVFANLFPHTERFLKFGNHDEWYQAYMWKKAPELWSDPDFHLENRIRCDENGFRVIKDKRIVMAGNLPILHGHEINMKGTTVNPARTLYLKVKHSCICSHLHVSSQHNEKDINGKHISTWSIGHMGQENPEYAPINSWNLGFAIIDYDETNFEVNNYKIINNKAYRT